MHKLSDLEILANMVRSGSLAHDCPTCERAIVAVLSGEVRAMDLFGPRHTASVRCESGRRDHCACDTCF